MNAASSDDRKTLRRQRQMLGLLFVLGLLGTGAELLLLGHIEGNWQKLPLALIGLGLVTFGWRLAKGGRSSLRVFQVVCWLLVAGGVAGLVQHYRGNLEFELEIYPSMAGWELFRESMTGATPALAPATLAGLGLLGLVGTFSGHSNS